MKFCGISSFVVVFVIYPGYAIYRQADLSITLLPATIAFGAFGITMTAIPGSPQIHNIIPTTYYGTTAAPLMSIVAVLMIGVPECMHLEWKARKARKNGLHFVEDPKYKKIKLDNSKNPSWHWFAGLIPLIIVVLLLNVMPKILLNTYGIELSSANSIVIALVGGILTVCLMNLHQLKKALMSAINDGANGSLGAIMNTACAVGFGSVVKAVPGFAVLKNTMLNMPGSILFSEAVAVNILADATGSASGRLDTLPHNGAVITLLAVSNCTHKESYWDVCVTLCIIPVVVLLVLSFVWGLFI